MAFALLVCVAPLSAHAHASPLDYEPLSGSQLSVAPIEVKIRFSERVEKGASRIIVKGEKGEAFQMGEAQVDTADAHFLSIPLKNGNDGTYIVSWSVVSADDGHFTKGGYAYSVGASVATVQVPQFEIVQLSALPEAVSIFVELFGNSLLWGTLIAFALLLRFLMPMMSDEQRSVVGRGYQALIFAGIISILVGGGTHLVRKTSELAALHGIPFAEALPLYLDTASGFATAIRSVVAIAFAAIFVFGRKMVLASQKVTLVEIVLFVCLAVFAYLSAKISHATANPFYQHFSVVVNFFHLIGKDLWMGLTGVLSLMYLSRTVRPLVPQLLPQVFKLFALASGVVGVSGSYIIWLHLKDLGNVTTTLWGERFILLFAAALFAVGLLAYHIVIYRWCRTFVGRFLPYTLPGAFAAGTLVVFFSALVIITSPPLERPHAKVLKTESNGLTIRLERSPYEDGKALLSVSPGEGTGDPVVLIGGEGGLLVDMERRFEGGYVFPIVLLPQEMQSVVVNVPQQGGYDAHATFSVSRGEFDPGEVEGHGRTFDAFTQIMIAFGVLCALCAVLLYALVGTYPESNPENSGARYVVGLVLGFAVASFLIGAVRPFTENSFKQECLTDGNGWHIMMPTKNSAPVSTTPQEGCMALGGSFHLPDVREYRLLKSPGESQVEFATDLGSLKAGVPTSIDFSIRDRARKPAILSLYHERYAHVIVVSADMKEFFHLHPDDFGSATPQMVRDASFSVPFTFPTAGDYIIAIDYAHGLAPVSKHVWVSATGTPMQEEHSVVYPERGTFDGYDVALDVGNAFAGEQATLTYHVSREGKEITDMHPYLAAAMHLAIVKNDLNEFVHTHGEVHPPDSVAPAPSSSTVHQHTVPPAKFGPIVEGHLVFPSAGIYTVFGQFAHEGKVVTSRFTVEVE